jgi:PAS domain S-box-containing protein
MTTDTPTHVTIPPNILPVLLEKFPDMIHSVDTNGQIVYANQTATRLLGYSMTELLSMNIRQIYADEILPAVERGFKELKEAGTKNVESLLKTKDGTRIPVEIRSLSIYDDTGRFIRTFSISRDIRDLKELQNQVVHTSRLAAIGETASGVAHDINNPLTIILLSNEMLQRSITTSKELSEPTRQPLLRCTADVQKAGDRIQRLSSHLRNFSRGIVEKHETVDLFDVLSDALFMLGSKITQARVRTINQTVKGRYFVHGMPNQIEQVFVNLIANACDAMENCPTRTLTIEILTKREFDKDCWKCTVSDTGTGIAPEHMDEVFQSFFTTKPKGKGTGLGLSISQSIISDHKGKITVQSEVGKGTTFSVILPQESPS